MTCSYSSDRPVIVSVVDGEIRTVANGVVAVTSHRKSRVHLIRRAPCSPIWAPVARP
jgi:hypothetical protein